MDLLFVTATGNHLSLEGELDLATLEALEKSVDALPRVGLVTVDVARLSFIDVEGYRELMRAADNLGDRGCLLLHAPQRILRRLLALLPVPRNVHSVPCTVHAA